MSLIALLVFVLILSLFWFALTRIASAFGLPQQIVVVIEVLLVIAAVLYLLSTVGVTGPTLRLR